MKDEFSDSDFDWSKATRGRHAAKGAKLAAHVRILDADLSKAFPDSRSVNEALRLLVEFRAKLQEKAKRPARTVPKKRAA